MSAMPEPPTSPVLEALQEELRRLIPLLPEGSDFALVFTPEFE